MTSTPGGPRLLLVEDDLPTRTTVAANLAGHDYRVEEAGSVAEALRALDARRPDLVVLDLGLPDRDGLEVVRHVRRDATTPILILSGESTDLNRNILSGTLQATAFLSKPFDRSRLLEAVKKILPQLG